MYFSDFPKIKYHNKFRISDITLRVKLKTAIKKNIFALESYRIQDGDRPEDVAYNIYGDANLHWVIFLCNDITNPVKEWLMSVSELEVYIKNKHPGGSDSIHHYELDGVIVSSDQTNALPVTNAEYEHLENEKHREIKILKPLYIQQIRRELKETLSHG